MGEAWFFIDHRLGLRATLLDSDSLRSSDLRRYNVIIAPPMWGGDLRSASESLKTWVSAGGTLIAIGSAARAMTSSEDSSGLSGARTLENSLGDLDAYEQAILREFVGRSAEVDFDALFGEHVPDALTYPWKDAPDRPSKEERKRRDDWNSEFMPSGVILAARADDRHWLTIGCPDEFPVLYTGGTILMSKPPVETAVRFGVFEEAPPADEEATEEKAKKPARAGWAMLPEGQRLRLRLAGLLWPEASHRIANSAVVTRESVGSGQVILFSTDPVFRAATLGQARLFLNAVVYGPGLGTREPIIP